MVYRIWRWIPYLFAKVVKKQQMSNTGELLEIFNKAEERSWANFPTEDES
jgi:hypothetical protein